MINKDRIVPITATDLISLYGVILAASGKNPTVVKATNPAQFEISNAGVQIANEPIETCDFTASSATLYFVPAYNFAGFTVNGAAVELGGVDVQTDGASLYTATLSSGAVTIAQIGF